MSPLAFEKREQGGKLSKIASASSLSLLLFLGQTVPMLGNPTGGTVVAGSATIGSAGPTLTINQSSNQAIINWQQFSIANGETTKFLVPTSLSATLNRVTGGNPSAIYGSLQSNGIVYLVNPSGIVVGPSGRIDTAGFLASTLDVSNQQFLKGGDLNFSGSSSASIDNEGIVHASDGDVYLIANQVKNGGTLSAPQGTVGLAAGSDILFQQGGNQHLFVQATPAGTTRALGVTNTGTIRAAAAELKAAGGNAYALAINNSGTIAATGFKKVNGQVYLTADGGNITNSGQISAQTADGNGGTIVLNGHGTTAKGTVLNSGSLVATGKGAGKKGGTVQVLGNQVGITDQGVVDVSGDAGGGTALIGGDEHGSNPAIPDADQTYLGPDATINADALTLGTGGKVILWGNETTQVYGQISAMGGALGGNGGFVETSGANLIARTAPDLAAPHGKGGTWLLDPTDVTISDTGSPTVTQATLLTELESGDVEIDASSGSGGGGTITWTQTSGDPMTVVNPSGNTLTLNAPVLLTLNGVTVNATGTGGLNIVLNSGVDANQSPETVGAINIQSSTLNLGGGNFTANGNGYTSTVDALGEANGINLFNSNINAGGGNISLTGNAGYTSPDGTLINAGQGVGIGSDGSTSVALSTTGTGNITIVGTFNQNITSNTFLSGVDIYQDGAASNINHLTVTNGLLSITGTVSQGTVSGTTGSASIDGVNVGTGSVLSSTGTGSVSVIGQASTTSSVLVSGSNSGSNQGVEISGNLSVQSGSMVIQGTAGTVDLRSATSPSLGHSEADGTVIDSGSTLTANNASTIAISGTGGTITGGAGISSDASGVVIVAQSTNTHVSADTGLIQITGIGGNGDCIVDGIHLDSSDGVSASITSTAGNISLIGIDPNITVVQTLANNTDGNAAGVDIGGNNTTGSIITASAGSIYISGTVTSGPDNTREAGVAITKNVQITAMGTGGTAGATAQGDVTIFGDTVGPQGESISQSVNAGVFIDGVTTVINASGVVADGFGGTGLTITGLSNTIDGSTGTSIDQNNGSGGVAFEPFTAGIAIVDGASIETTGTAPITFNGTGGTNSNTLDSSATPPYVSATNGGTSGSYGVLIFSPTFGQTTSISSGGLLTVVGTAGSSPISGVGVMIGGTSNAGAVTITSSTSINLRGTGGTGNTTSNSLSPNAGVSIFDPGNSPNSGPGGGTINIAANGGDLTITGTSGTSNADLGINGEPYFTTFDNQGAIDPSLTASGSLLLISTLGGISNTGWAGELVATNTTVSTPAGSTSDLTEDDSNGPLTLTGLLSNSPTGGSFTVSGDTGLLTLAPSNVENLTVTNSAAGAVLSSIAYNGSVNVTASGGVAINGAISGTGPVTIADDSGNIMLGSGGSISASGSGNNVILAAGTDLASSHYIINNSTATTPIQAASGNFYLYSGDPTNDSFGSISVLPANMVFNAVYPGVNLPASNEELFYVASANATGPNAPGGGSGGNPGGPGGGGSSGTPPPPSTGTGGAAGGGSNIVPPAAAPQPPPPLNAAPPVLGSSGPPPPPIGFVGDGTGTIGGSDSGGLASSSGNGGQVGSGDAAQLGGGQLNNVANPAASGALSLALGAPVFHNLQDALQALGDFSAADLPPDADNTAGSAGDGTEETILSGGEVAEINDDKARKIKPSQAPPQLQQAMSSNVLNGMPAGVGH
jgi:trimeric autotransporter adhesin